MSDLEITPEMVIEFTRKHTTDALTEGARLQSTAMGLVAGLSVASIMSTYMTGMTQSFMSILRGEQPPSMPAMDQLMFGVFFMGVMAEREGWHLEYTED